MVLPREVGFSHVDYVCSAGKNKVRFLTWEEVECDGDGWADASEWLPARFEIVKLKLANREFNIPGWWCGTQWEGRRMKASLKVLRWKREALEH